VLAHDVEFIDIDGRHWANWIELLTPPAVMDDPRWAVLFIEHGELVKAVQNQRGALDLAQVPFTNTSASALAKLRDDLGVGAVVVLTTDALPRLLAAIEGNLSIGMDMPGQGLTCLRALKALDGDGLWTWPRILDIIPTPPVEALQRTFDLLIPNKTTMVAYIVNDDHSDIYASIIATKKHGHIDTVATHLAIADAVPARAFAKSFRSQYKRLLRTVGDRFEKPSVGVFLDRETFYRILTGPTDQLGREINARNLIIDPAPTWLLGLLGGATVAVLAGRGAKTLAKFLPPGARKLAAEFAQQAQGAVRDSPASPFALLGFDPIELWLSLRRYYRRPDAHH
jgi:hypothetical protein